MAVASDTKTMNLGKHGLTTVDLTILTTLDFLK